MPIQATGLSSGLDVNGIISQLMSVERQPITLLDKKEAGFQAKISALGLLKSALSSVQTAAQALRPATGQSGSAKFAAFKANLADSSIATATASSQASPSTYSVDVLSLAHENRLVSAADPTIEAGAQTIQIVRGSVDAGVFTASSGFTPLTVELDGSDNTLEGIRDAINAAKAGVKASIVSSADGDRLTVSAGATGTSAVLKITGGISALNYDPTAPVSYDDDTPPAVMSEVQAASNARVKFNGITVESISNTFTNVAPGVNLTATDEGATTLSVVQDLAPVKALITNFVKAYNDANKSFGDLGGYNSETKVAGPLNGDTALRGSQSALRAVINSVPSELSGASLTRLSEIGVTYQKDGTLAFEASKFDSAAKADFDSVASLVAAYGTAFADASDDLLGRGGFVATETNGLNQSVKSITTQRTALESRMTAIEARYRRQFTSLDTMIASMNQTSTFLEQQLGSLSRLRSTSTNS